MNTAKLFIQALEHEGVTHMFGIPGEETLELLEALRTSSIRFITTRHEQAAGFMAATYGRLTGRVGVCLSTLGPGATNLVTAAAYAQLGAMPMLMITGQKPVKQSKQGHFQIVNTVEMFRPMTKLSKQIVSGASVPALVHEACRTAVEERPGAVHVELPEDIAAEHVDSSVTFLPTYQPRRSAGDEKAVREAVTMIEKSIRPLILVGAGANRKRVSKSLLEFIKKTGIPFFNTQMGKGVIDERHPLFLGTAALSKSDYLHCAIDQADLIINIGHDVVEKPPFIMTPHGAKVIHVNFSRPRVDDVYFPQWEVIGDIGNIVWQMKECIEKQPHWNLDLFAKTKKQFDTHLLNRVSDDAYPLLPQRIVADVRRVMGDNDIVALDNGMYKLWFARNYRAYAPNTLLLDNALATMGAGLPSAIASKIVYPDRRVLAISGDGGFMMTVADLETAIRLQLDLVILVIRDGGYGMIQWKQKALGMRDFGLSFGNPDFIKLAESFGARGHQIEHATDLVPEIERSFATPGVHVIDVPIDYSENERVFDQEPVCS